MSAIYGGSGRGISIFAGGEDVEVAKYDQYKNSAEASAKRQFVTKIIGVFNELNFKNIPPPPESDNPVDVAKAADLLKDAVYDTLKRGIKDDPALRKALCKKLAKAINEVFGSKIINDNLSEDSVCGQATEFVLSFARGLHIEYFKIKADVKICLNNMKLLQEFMKNASAKIGNMVTESKDNEMKSKYRQVAEIYNSAAAELDRQFQMMSNLMNVTTIDQMEGAFKTGNDFQPIIQAIGYGKFSQSPIADNILKTLLGLSAVGVLAGKIDAALKQVGMNVNDYRSSSVEEFNKKLTDLMKDYKGDFSKFSTSSDLLSKNKLALNNDEWKELVDAIQGKSGGALDAREVYDSEGNENYDASGNRISDFDKKLDKTYKERMAIIKLFSKQIGLKYDQLIATINNVVKRLGAEIQINEQSNIVRNQLKHLLVVGNPNSRIELALIGVFDDIRARQARETFLNCLAQLEQSCGAHPQFSELSTAVKELHELINHFYDTSRAKFGGADDKKESYGDVMPEILRSGASLKKAINDFVYFYYLARIRLNIGHSADAVEKLSDDYVKLLGIAVANRIDNLREAREDTIKIVTDKKAEVFNADGDAAAVVKCKKDTPGAGWAFKFEYPDAETGKADMQLKNYEKYIKARTTAVENFYAAVQAVDLYLKEFTVEISRNPAKVLELKKMIDETEIISNWFNDKAGDSLCKAFVRNTVETATYNADVADKEIDSNVQHYYEFVGKQNAAAFLTYVNTANVNNFGINMTKLDAKDKNLTELFNNYAGLKNLIAMFAKIGNFGGKTLFLSPSQILKYLTDYIKNSAFILSKTVVGATHVLAFDFSVTQSTNTSDFGDKLDVENRLLVHVIKAMVGKILTTVGLHDILRNITPVGAITQTRIILGGGVTTDAKAEAAELYFRLPRLVEYYRKVLVVEVGASRGDLKGNLATLDEKIISLLPDMSGMFGLLTKTIFRNRDSEYSDNDVTTIIDEINKIYDKYGDTSKAIDEYVADINMKFGLVKRRSLANYYAEIGRLEEAFDSQGTESVNYKLFPDEDSTIIGRAPSDMYKRAEKSDPKVAKVDAYIYGDGNTGEADYKREFEGFRERIDTQFAKIKPEQLDASYDLIIRHYARKISEAKSREDRVALAHSLIQETTVLKVDDVKLQMFQETVIMGLQSLAFINAGLDRFIGSVYTLDFVRNAIIYGLSDSNSVSLFGNGFDFSSKDDVIHKQMFTEKFEKFVAIHKENKNKFLEKVFEKEGNFHARSGTLIGKVNLGPLINGGAIDKAEAEKILNGTTAFDGTKDSHKRYADILLATNLDECMTLMIDEIFRFVSASNGLVDISYTVDKISFDISKLREHVNDVLKSVKMYVEVFRNIFPDAYIDKFVMSTNQDTPLDNRFENAEKLNIYYLEEHLVYNKFDNQREDNVFLFSNFVRSLNNVKTWLLTKMPNMLPFLSGDLKHDFALAPARIKRIAAAASVAADSDTAKVAAKGVTLAIGAPLQASLDTVIDEDTDTLVADIKAVVAGVDTDDSNKGTRITGARTVANALTSTKNKELILVMVGAVNSGVAITTVEIKTALNVYGVETIVSKIESTSAFRLVFNPAKDKVYNNIAPYPYGTSLRDIVYKFNSRTAATTDGIFKFVVTTNQTGEILPPMSGFDKHINKHTKLWKYTHSGAINENTDASESSVLASLNSLILRLLATCSEISPGIKTYNVLVNNLCSGVLSNLMAHPDHSLPDLYQTNDQLYKMPSSASEVEAALKNYTSAKLAYRSHFGESFTPVHLILLPDASNANNAGEGVKAVDGAFTDITTTTAGNAGTLKTNLFTFLAPSINRGAALAAGDVAKGADATKNQEGYISVSAGGAVIRNLLLYLLDCTIDTSTEAVQTALFTGEYISDMEMKYRNVQNLIAGVNELNKIAKDVGIVLANNDNSLVYAATLNCININEADVLAFAGGVPTRSSNVARGVNAGRAIVVANRVINRYNLIVEKINEMINLGDSYVIKNDDRQNRIVYDKDSSMSKLIGAYNGPKDQNNLLLSTVAYLLKTVSSTVVKNTTIPANMALSLTDVPLFVREQLRANLPLFQRMFDLVSQKSEFVLKFVKNIKFADEHFAQVCLGNGRITAEHNILAALPHKIALDGVKENIGLYYADQQDLWEFSQHTFATKLNESVRQWTKQDNKLYITGLLSKIAETAFTMSDSCASVLKELGGRGIFGEVGEGSIEAYERRYHVKPLTPYSLFTSLFPNTNDDFAGADGAKRLFGTNTTYEFKRNYAIRGVFNQALSPENTPYNAALKIEGDYYKFVNKVHTLMNAHYNMLLVNKMSSNLYHCHRFGELKKPDVITSYIEESDQKQYFTDLRHSYGQDPNSDKDRDTQITNNIIDMNIIPFNVHMLMRDIPLANVYNYSYTFDKFIESFYKKKTGTTTLFKTLMQKPYSDFTINANGAHAGADTPSLHAIFRGDDDLEMGRPKFLSDQLFGKVLLQNVYTESRYAMNQAPAANTSGIITALEKAGKAFNLLLLSKISNNKLGEYKNDNGNGANYDNADFDVANVGSYENAWFTLIDTIKQVVNGTNDANVINTLKGMLTKVAGFFNGIALSPKFLLRDYEDFSLLADKIYANDTKNVDYVGFKSAIDESNTANNIKTFAMKWNIGPLKIDSYGTASAQDLAKFRKLHNLISELAIEYIIVFPIDTDTHKDRTRVRAVVATAVDDDTKESSKKIIEAVTNRVSHTADKASKVAIISNQANSIVAPAFSTDNVLTYVKDNEIHSIPVNNRTLYDNYSNRTFNTHIVRNLFFITNLNRVLRQAFENSLNAQSSFISRGASITNPNITEFGKYPAYPTEMLHAKKSNGMFLNSQENGPTDFYNANPKL